MDNISEKCCRKKSVSLQDDQRELDLKCWAVILGPIRDPFSGRKFFEFVGHPVQQMGVNWVNKFFQSLDSFLVAKLGIQKFRFFPTKFWFFPTDGCFDSFYFCFQLFHRSGHITGFASISAWLLVTVRCDWPSRNFPFRYPCVGLTWWCLMTKSKIKLNKHSWNIHNHCNYFAMTIAGSHYWLVVSAMRAYFLSYPRRPNWWVQDIFHRFRRHHQLTIHSWSSTTSHRKR